MIWNVFEPDYLGSCEISRKRPKKVISHNQPLSLQSENAPKRSEPPPYTVSLRTVVIAKKEEQMPQKNAITIMRTAAEMM